jgi:hypothetical protein
MSGIVTHLMRVRSFDWLGNSVDAVVYKQPWWKEGKDCLGIRRFRFQPL